MGGHARRRTLAIAIVVILVAAGLAAALARDHRASRARLARQIRQHGDEWLFDAAMGGELERVKTLAHAGAGLDFSALQTRDTPLHVAVEFGHDDVVAFLAERGADVSATNYHGRTPLHTASAKGRLLAMRTLLEHGADPGVADRSGFTPLHLACGQRQAPAATALLDHGADMDARDRLGRTPLAHALLMKNHRTAELLRQRGATE